jgi:ABC-type bacteriocin/lantibiotic exporter with double-glycine peptidase domain
MIDKKENSSMKLLDVDFHALNEEQLKYILTKVELISTLSMKKSLHESHLLDFILFFMSTFILLILMNVYDVSKTVIAISFSMINIYYFFSAYRKLKSVNKKQTEENSKLNDYIHKNLLKK